MQSIKEDINRVLRTRTFVHYNASFYLAKEMRGVIEALREYAEQQPEQGLELVWYFIKKSKRLFNRIDDSSGVFGDEVCDVCRLLVSCLDHSTDSLARTKIVRGIFDEWEKNDYGYFDILYDVMTESKLTETEISGLVSQLEKIIAVAERKQAEDPKDFSSSFQLGKCVFLYGRLLVQGGKEEEGIQFIKRFLSRTLDYDRLGNLLLKQGCLRDAETTFIKGLEKYPGLKGHLYEGLISAYESLDERENLEKTLLEYFSITPSETLFDKIKQCNEHNWENIRPKLISSLNNEAYYHILIQICLAEGNLIEAFHVAQNHKAPGQLLKPLGKKLEKEYPLEAIWCYEKCVNEVIGRGSRYYNYAVKFIKNMKSLYEKSDNNTAFEKYILETKEKHKRRPSLLKRLNQFC